MVQFVGVNFLDEHVHTTVVDRKARVLQTASVPLPGIVSGPSPNVFEVPPQEWTRAGFLALQDMYANLPIKHRRLWGFAISGPQGWIAVDPDLDPLSPLRLTPGCSPLIDFRGWLESNPHARAHIFALLSPKDYFRLRVSGGLAADITQASQTGLLRGRESFWSRENVEAQDIEPRWLPPVFASATSTGRISEEGVDQTGIPGGIWVVAGSESSAATQISAGVFAPGELLILLSSGNVEIRYVVGQNDSQRSPDGWERVHSATPSTECLVQRTSLSALEDAASLTENVNNGIHALQTAGHEVTAIVVDSRAAIPEKILDALAHLNPEPILSFFVGETDPGTAFLAGLAKGMFKNPQDLLKKVLAAQEHEDPE